MNSIVFIELVLFCDEHISPMAHIYRFKGGGVRGYKLLGL